MSQSEGYTKVSAAFAQCEKAFSKVWKVKHGHWDIDLLAFQRGFFQLGENNVMLPFSCGWLISKMACT